MVLSPVFDVQNPFTFTMQNIFSRLKATENYSKIILILPVYCYVNTVCTAGHVSTLQLQLQW